MHRRVQIACSTVGNTEPIWQCSNCVTNAWIFAKKWYGYYLRYLKNVSADDNLLSPNARASTKTTGERHKGAVNTPGSRLISVVVTLCRPFLPMFPIFHDRDRTIRSWSLPPIGRTIRCVRLPVRSKYDCCTNKAWHWYEGSIWSTLVRFPDHQYDDRYNRHNCTHNNVRTHSFCQFATTMKRTPPIIVRSLHAFGDHDTTDVRYIRPPLRYRYDVND